MTQGGHMVAPYPSGPGGYGDPQAPPPGFNMNYDPGQPPVVMYQPGPVPGPEHGVQPGAISPAQFSGPATVPVGVPPGLEYLTQVWMEKVWLNPTLAGFFFELFSLVFVLK